MHVGASLAGWVCGPRAARGRALVALVAVLALVGACGSGGTTTTQQFVFQGMGPAGGQAQAGPVLLTVPPGALTQDTGVAILPEWAALPIAAPDGCKYTYVGPTYCCGPVGQVLQVDGVLRMGYDESLIPAGFTELDLVLLIWDNANGVMRPRPMPPVVQDTVQNFFEDVVYNQLGHVAIGLRDCTNANPFNLLIQNGGQPGAAKPAGDASTQGAQAQVAALYQADAADLLPPALVSTFGLNFEGFVPSPDQQQVLFAVQDPSSFDRSVQRIRIDGTVAPVVIAADDTANGVFLQTNDPMYGWLAQGGGNHAWYVQYVSPIMGQGLPSLPSQRYEVWRRIGDASAAATRQHFTDASFSFIDDLRQSVSGAHLGVSSFDFFGGLYYEDVAAVPAGLPASLAVVPPSDGPQPPRFMPGSEDLYTVTNDSLEVNEYTPAGAFVQTLFALGAPGDPSADRLVDFALAPDGNAFAAVVESDSKGTFSELWMGTLADGVIATYFFGEQVFVNEMIWHPQQTGVFLDLSGYLVGLFSIRDDDGFYVGQNSLLTFGLSNVDVNRLDGRIVTLTGNAPVLDAQAAVLPPGIYIWPPDADSSDPSLHYQIFPSGIDDPQHVRWHATWRHAAGRSSSRVR